MSVPIEIVNLYGGMDMDEEYLVVRISFKNEKKKQTKVFNFCMMKKHKDINLVVIY